MKIPVRCPQRCPWSARAAKCAGAAGTESPGPGAFAGSGRHCPRPVCLLSPPAPSIQGNAWASRLHLRYRPGVPSDLPHRLLLGAVASHRVGRGGCREGTAQGRLWEAPPTPGPVNRALEPVLLPWGGRRPCDGRCAPAGHAPRSASARAGAGLQPVLLQLKPPAPSPGCPGLRRPAPPSAPSRAPEGLTGTPAAPGLCSCPRPCFFPGPGFSARCQQG